MRCAVRAAAWRTARSCVTPVAMPAKGNAVSCWHHLPCSMRVVWWEPVCCDSYNGGTMVLIDQPMDKGVDEQQPLLINEFLVSRISQSTSFQGATNTITVSFSTRCLLKNEFNNADMLLICNVVGTSTPTQPTLPLTELDASGTAHDVASYGAWTREMFVINYQAWKQGCLVISPLRTEPKKVYSFSFTVANNPQGQYAPDISMHLFRKRLYSWTFVMERVMDYGLGNARPFLIQGLVFSRGIQSLSSRSAVANLINVSFELRGSLFPPAVLTLSVRLNLHLYSSSCSLSYLEWHPSRGIPRQRAISMPQLP